jgi:hypothetical protein
MRFFYVEPRASKETLKNMHATGKAFSRDEGGAARMRKKFQNSPTASLCRMRASLVAGAVSVPRGARHKHRLWCGSSGGALTLINADVCNASYQAVFDGFSRGEF